MSERKRWSVWSLTPDHTAWLEVGQDFPQDEAEADAARKNALAVKYKMAGAVFVALPAGQQPGPEHVPPVQEKVEPLTSELPDGSVVAGASVTWIRNHPNRWCQWRASNGGHYSDRQVQEELDAKRAEILRRGSF